LRFGVSGQELVYHREADLQGFVRWGKKALEVERDSQILAVMSLYLAWAGRIEVARRYAEEAASLDPLSWLTTYSGAYVDVFSGNAHAAFERMQALEVRFAPGEPWTAFDMGFAAFQAGLEEEAGSWLRKAVDGGSLYYSNLSRLLLHILKDDQDGAEEMLETSALTTVAGKVGVGSYLVGAGFARIGKTEEAFEWLERAVDQGFTNHRFLGEYDRLLAPLRGTDRFETLLERARAKEAALEV
jgi:tetratricopeptide (TPR) repeat protein